MLSQFALQLRVFCKRLALEQSCRWTREQLTAHQLKAAAEIRTFAVRHSPFYARYHRGLQNSPLSQLPVLTKAALMENFNDLVTDRSVRLSDVNAHIELDSGDRLFRNRYVALSTSGSTGLRGVFLFSPAEWVHCLASIARPMKWAGVAPNPFRPERSAMVASATPWHYSARIGRALRTRMMPTLRLDAGEPLDSMVRQLNEWKPAVFVAYPSVLRQLADEQLAGRLKIAPRVCAASAELLTPETRRRVRDAWAIRVFETYGATEYAPIAAECPAGRMHLFEDGAVIENTDDRGRPVPAGELGERVLLTIFNRRTQPLIRYEISDMIRLSDVKCECGRPFRCMEEIEGRQEDMLTFPSASDPKRLVAVHPNVFHRLLETVPATGWQIILDNQGITINLTGLQHPPEQFHLESAMQQLLKAEGVAVPPVSVRAAAELRRGKTGKAPLILNLKAI